MGLLRRIKQGIPFVNFMSQDASKIKRLGSSYFVPILGDMTLYHSIDQLKSYLDIPEVQAVINTRARMKARGRLKVINRKTGEESKIPLAQVIKNPNWFQSQKEFKRQTCLFRDIFGREYIYMLKPYGVKPANTKALFTLPPQNMISKTTDDRPFFMYNEPAISYEFKWDQKLYQIDKDFIIHYNDNRVNMLPDNWTEGSSMLDALMVPINNIRAAYEARNSLIVNRGALGILSNNGKDAAGTLPLNDKEKEALQKKFEEYGVTQGKYPIIITSLALNWQQMSVDDQQKLGLFPEVEADFNRICDAYGVAREMFSKQEGTTFENQKWGERKTWENTIIPEDQEWVDGLNASLGLDDSPDVIVTEYVDIAVLQENMKERAASLKMLIDALNVAVGNGLIDMVEAQRELARQGIGPLA